MIFWVFFLSLLNALEKPDIAGTATCPTEDCYIDYCFNLDKGAMYAHFGRWATPFNPVSHMAPQHLCLEKCNYIISEPVSALAESSDGRYKTEQIAELKTGQLSGKFEMAFSPEGRLYLLDIPQSEIIIFDEGFTEIARFGQKGAGAGEFERASDINIDENGIVYVLDAYLARINRFNPDGEYIDSYPLQNQATDMIIIGNSLCTHTGGAIPKDYSAVNCYNKNTLAFESSLLNNSDVMKYVKLGISNVTFNVIQKQGSNLIILHHPLDGVIKIFDENEKLRKEFSIINELFAKPEFPENYDLFRHQPSDFVDSIIHGIYVTPEQIRVLLVEFGTGNKFLDVYDFEGNRKVDNLIPLNRNWPTHSDAEGKLYSISFDAAENKAFLIAHYLN